MEPKGLKQKKELSDLFYGDGEALPYAVGTLFPSTLYAFATEIIASNPSINVGEAIGVGLAGSFALRYADKGIDALIPEMRRESYVRKNQREYARIVARTITGGVTGAALAYCTDAPFLSTTALVAAAFASGRMMAEKIKGYENKVAISLTAVFLGSSLYVSLAQVIKSFDLFKKTEGQEEYVGDVAAPEPEVEYTAKPPFTVWPVESERKQVNSCFGERRKRNSVVVTQHHRGIDIQAAWHTPVVSVGNGVVVETYKSGGIIKIDHGLGIFTEYGHLDVIDVSPGQNIVAGERLGLSGGSADGRNGPSTGPHLHFMVVDQGVSSYLQDATGNAAVLKGKVNALCYMDEDIDFSVSKTSGCNTQGGRNKYCQLYKSPLELVLDIEEKYGKSVQSKTQGTEIDPGLVYALIAQESKGVAHAKNKNSSAAGLMQFTKDTGFRYGLCDNKTCDGRDDRYDPEESIAAGVRYYQQLQQEFKGYAERDIFAIAAYNAGGELIKRAIAKTERGDPTWDQVGVVLTQDLVGDVYGTKSATARERKVLEIKNHVSGVLGYYSFYVGSKEKQ